MRTYIVTIDGWYMRTVTVYPRGARKTVQIHEFLPQGIPRTWEVPRDNAAKYLNEVRQMNDSGIGIRRMQ